MIKKFTLILCCLSTSVSAEDLTDRGATNLLSEIEYLNATRKPLPGPFSGNELREIRADTVYFLVCNGGSVEDWVEHAEQVLTVAMALSIDIADVSVEPDYFARVGMKGCDLERSQEHETLWRELQQVGATLAHNDNLDQKIEERISALNTLVGLEF